MDRICKIYLDVTTYTGLNLKERILRRVKQKIGFETFSDLTIGNLVKHLFVAPDESGIPYNMSGEKQFSFQARSARNLIQLAKKTRINNPEQTIRNIMANLEASNEDDLFTLLFMLYLPHVAEFLVERTRLTEPSSMELIRSLQLFSQGLVALKKEDVARNKEHREGGDQVANPNRGYESVKFLRGLGLFHGLDRTCQVYLDNIQLDTIFKIRLNLSRIFPGRYLLWRELWMYTGPNPFTSDVQNLIYLQEAYRAIMEFLVPFDRIKDEDTCRECFDTVEMFLAFLFIAEGRNPNATGNDPLDMAIVWDGATLGLPVTIDPRGDKKAILRDILFLYKESNPGNHPHEIVLCLVLMTALLEKTKQSSYGHLLRRICKIHKTSYRGKSVLVDDIIRFVCSKDPAAEM